MTDDRTVLDASADDDTQLVEDVSPGHYEINRRQALATIKTLCEGMGFPADEERDALMASTVAECLRDYDFIEAWIVGALLVKAGQQGAAQTMREAEKQMALMAEDGIIATPED